MLTIILPVKNEPYLPFLLWDIALHVSVPHEVLVQTEKGLGFAVKCGLEKAKGDVVCVLDADGSHPVAAIDGMVKKLCDADIVVGSRYGKYGVTQDTFIREVISRVYNRFAQVLFGLTVKDNMSGFIVAKREVFKTYPISNRGYKFGLELLVRSKQKYKAFEYPIVFAQRKMGVSKASPKEAYNTLVFMLNLKAKFKGKTQP